MIHRYKLTLAAVALFLTGCADFDEPQSVTGQAAVEAHERLTEAELAELDPEARRRADPSITMTAEEIELSMALTPEEERERAYEYVRRRPRCRRAWRVLLSGR